VRRRLHDGRYRVRAGSLVGHLGLDKQDTAAAHGAPLGDDEIKLCKRFYGWPEDAKFLVPAGVREHFTAGIGARGAEARRRWMDLFAGYRAKYPELANEIELMQKRELPAGWDRDLPVFSRRPDMAGRDGSGKVLNVLGRNIPPGSWEARPTSTHVDIRGRRRLPSGEPEREEPHFGGREHSMGAIVNGLSLSKLRLFGATFFIFGDYARPAIRLAALMELPAIFVFPHHAMSDSEEGPTHQPVEHLAFLRAIPRLVTLRQADANEVVEAYRYVVQLRHQPAVLALSRQPLLTLDRTKYAPASGVARGAYVFADTPGGSPAPRSSSSLPGARSVSASMHMKSCAPRASALE
jgi:transketolase